jgi:hypothetical protein
MIKNKKVTSLILFLLVATSILTSCSFDQDKEARKLKLEKKVQEEKDLIETFKSYFKPEQGKQFEENLTKVKNEHNGNIEAWKREIKEVEELENSLESSEDEKSRMITYMNIIQMFGRLIPKLSVVDVPQYKTIPILTNYLAILYNLKEQAELDRIIKK